MKVNFKRLSSLLIISNFVLFACGPGQLISSTTVPTSTLFLTQTPTNTSTLTSTATPTPDPTSTLTPTAISAMGIPIFSEDWEVTVVDAVTHEGISGESKIERPEQGYIFVDVGVKIKNVNPEKNDLLKLRAKQAIIFEIFDYNGQPIELYKYGVAAQDMNPLYVPIRWAPGKKQVDQAFYDYIFIEIVANINMQEYATMSIRLILNAEKESIKKPLFLQFQDVPLIQFSVEN